MSDDERELLGETSSAAAATTTTTTKLFPTLPLPTVHFTVPVWRVPPLCPLSSATTTLVFATQSFIAHGKEKAVCSACEAIALQRHALVALVADPTRAHDALRALLNYSAMLDALRDDDATHTILTPLPGLAWRDARGATHVATTLREERQFAAYAVAAVCTAYANELLDDATTMARERHDGGDGAQARALSEACELTRLAHGALRAASSSSLTLSLLGIESHVTLVGLAVAAIRVVARAWTGDAIAEQLDAVVAYCDTYEVMLACETATHVAYVQYARSVASIFQRLHRVEQRARASNTRRYFSDVDAARDAHAWCLYAERSARKRLVCLSEANGLGDDGAPTYENHMRILNAIVHYLGTLDRVLPPRSTSRMGRMLALAPDDDEEEEEEEEEEESGPSAPGRPSIDEDDTSAYYLQRLRVYERKFRERYAPALDALEAAAAALRKSQTERHRARLALLPTDPQHWLLGGSLGALIRETAARGDVPLATALELAATTGYLRGRASLLARVCHDVNGDVAQTVDAMDAQSRDATERMQALLKNRFLAAVAAADKD